MHRIGRAVLVLTVVSLGAPVAAAAAATTPAAPENASFFYQPLTPQELPSVGAPKLMVLTHLESAVVARAAGVRAYKYLQFNWFPTTGSWNGTTADQRAQWRLCGPSGAPVGDGTSSSRFLWYADFNERGFVDAMVAYALRMKARGFDGVFIDVSGRALLGPRSKTLSTCTENPVTPNLRSSDAYVRFLQRVKALGLRVAINFPSPFEDPLLRPAPVGARTLNDLRPIVDFVLHENAASIDQMPFPDLMTRLRGDAQFSGAKVVEMAKSQRMPGTPGKSENERAVWALAKLSGQPVVLNTGNDLCIGAGAAPGGCLRMGLAPDLVNLQLGAAIDPLPRGTACNMQTGACAWYRRFQSGFVVYNPNLDATVRKISLPLTADGSCRLANEVRGQNITGGRCVKSLAVNVKPGQGRIFTLSH
jgi:hypothetical protein